ncbi:pyridoxal phosphate-dependent aminotransferase [uncultured Paludibaculum sp.]|uniref:pyridoxal phosphate-dependent aminotransferase n=1 Tax=uncultured Paludibaculum sp. TaxID=1765020 RepID=UPI002AAC1736|nr:pyridoxal phosphate-dependent aminotransferase [uncultured Paludibaculum sp.]
MFSRRTPASLAPNRLSLLLAERKAAGAPVIDLTVSNPTGVGLDYPREEILAALRDARSLSYEPTARGLLEAREAIAEWHAGQGAPALPDSLILAGSTSEAYGWLFKLLCEPGDEVLAPRPSYPLFECLADLDAVRMVQYALVEEFAWGIDLAELESRVRPNTRAIILVNPNNPTGTYVKRDIWLKLQEFAAYRGLAIVSDEVFFDYAWGPDPRRVSSLQGPHLALTFTLSGLSKIAGLPQMKLGWIHVAGPEPLKREALDRLEWIADSYLPVSAPIQHAAARWLELTPRIQHSIRLRTGENLDSLQQAVGLESGCRVRTPEGGWCAMLEVPRIHSDEEWALMLLENHSIWMQPGYFYDFQREGFLVASLLPEPESFRTALDRLSVIFGPH